MLNNPEINNDQLYSVYSINLAKYLIARGYLFVSIRPMKEDNNKVIIRFRDSKDLRKQVEDYMNMQKTHKYTQN